MWVSHAHASYSGMRRNAYTCEGRSFTDDCQAAEDIFTLLSTHHVQLIDEGGGRQCQLRHFGQGGVRIRIRVGRETESQALQRQGSQAAPALVRGFNDVLTASPCRR